MNKDIKKRSTLTYLKDILIICIVAASHYLLGKVFLSLNPQDFYIGLFWPVSGVAVFFVLRYGVKVFPAIFIGQLTLLINLNHGITGLQDSQQLFLFIAQALNVVFFVFLARFIILRCTAFQGDILDKTNIPRLVLLVGPVSSFIPTLISVYLLKDTALILDNGIIFSALTWWVGDSFGITICLPVLLLIFNKNSATFSQKTIVLVTVSTLLVATLVMFQYAEKQETLRIENILIHKGEVIARDINNKFQKYIRVSWHLSNHIADMQQLSLDDFNQFAKQLLDKNKGIKSLNWGVLVNGKERGPFEKTLQKLYGKEIHITEINSINQLQVSPLKSRYYPVKFVYPYEEYKYALGIDFTAQQGQLNELLLAIENNEDTLSSQVDWAEDKSLPDNYITLYSPFYDNQRHNQTVGQQFAGYLSLAIDKKLFFSELISDSRLYQQIQLQITDSLDKSAKPFFQYNSDKNYKVHVEYLTQIVNNNWSIDLRTNQSFITEGTISTAWYILLFGLIITALMLMLLLLLIRKQQHLQKLVDHKQEVVKESLSHQSLLSATFNTHQAILITDPEYNIIRVNSAFCEVMGYTEVEVVGENPRIFSSGRQSTEFYKEMWTKLLSTGRFEGEIWNRRKNGEIFPEYQTITEIRNAQGEIIYYISVFSDITKLKQNEEKIRHQAFYDLLTLLPNKMLFLDRLDQEVAYARRFDGVGALLLIDIDNFKEINDLLGHHFGDDVLIELSHRLTTMMRNTDTIAHLGGDDFIVFMPVEKNRGVGVQKSAILVAEKILEQIHLPFLIKNQSHDLTASLGISYIKNNKCTASDILRQAETALYQAKLTGKNRYTFFQEEY